MVTAVVLPSKRNRDLTTQGTVLATQGTELAAQDCATSRDPRERGVGERALADALDRYR